MRSALDTNILSALWAGEPMASRISTSLGEARARGGLVICAPVFVELLAHASVTEDFVEQFLKETGVATDFRLVKPYGDNPRRTLQRMPSDAGGLEATRPSDYL